MRTKANMPERTPGSDSDGEIPWMAENLVGRDLCPL